MKSALNVTDVLNVKKKVLDAGRLTVYILGVNNIMQRKILYNNSDIELVSEDDSYVLVKKNSKAKVVQRTAAADTKVLQKKNTVKSYLTKCHMVYTVFDCPSINGKLLIFTTDGDPLRHCYGGHELT